MPTAATGSVMPSAMLALLSFVAGFVDSCTFLALFGVYVAQVTGSFVVLGAEAFSHSAGVLVQAVAIPAFVLAAVVTAALVAITDRGRRALAWALALETLLLIGFTTVVAFVHPVQGPDAGSTVAAAALGLAAMGVQSASVRMLSGGAGSTNVMTTNTTQVAIDATDWMLALLAQRRNPATPQAAERVRLARSRCSGLLLLVLAFLLGTVVGALAFLLSGVRSLVLPIGTMLVLTGWAAAKARHAPA